MEPLMAPAYAIGFLTLAVLFGSIYGKRIYAGLRALYFIRAIPGPKNPSIINGDFTPAVIKQVHRWYKKWADMYGPVFSLRLSYVPVVIVSDPTLMPDLFKLPRSFLYRPFEIITLDRPNIFTRDHSDPVWKAVRKAVTKVFTQSNLQHHFPAMLRHVTALVHGAWAEAARGGEPLEFVHVLKMLMIHMLGEVGFEIDMAAPERQPEMERALKSMGEALGEMAERVVAPFRTLYFWDPSVWRGARDVARWRAVISEFAKEAMRADSRASDAPGGGEAPRSIIAALRGARLADGRLVPLEQVIAEVATFFFVGTDTTSHTLAWTLLLLTQHPQCKRKIVQELEAAGLKARDGVPAREITVADLPKLTYINACLQESMRLEPTVGVGTFRDVEEDMVIGGHFVAKGTSIGLPFLATFTSARNFPDSEKFIPERWLDSAAAKTAVTVTRVEAQLEESGASDAAGHATHGGAPKTVSRCPMTGAEAGAQQPSALPRQSFPFSVGDRNCIGRALAQMEMPLFLAKLFSHYDVHFAADKQSLDEIYVGEKYEATSAPPRLYLRLSAV